MKTQKGFATVILLSLLPFLVAAGLAVFALFSLLRTDLAGLNACRVRQLEIQNKAGRNLQKLLAMNPKALRLRLLRARAQKALALAAGNPVAVAAAESALLAIEIKRAALHTRQRALIEKTEFLLQSAATELGSRIVHEETLSQRGLRAWFRSETQVQGRKPPHFAVQADLPEVAPLYGPSADFEKQQSWQQSWRLEFKTVSWVPRFLQFHGRFERSCSTSIYPEGPRWIARLKKDRFLSKGFF